MAYILNGVGQRRLDEFFGGIGSILRRADRKESFALYACGLFGDSERKSIEPIAARVCGKPERCRAVHDQLLHFIGVSPWSDRDIRRFAADYALLELAKREPIEDWIPVQRTVDKDSLCAARKLASVDTSATRWAPAEWPSSAMRVGSPRAAPPRAAPPPADVHINRITAEAFSILPEPPYNVSSQAVALPRRLPKAQLDAPRTRSVAHLRGTSPVASVAT